MIPEGQLIQFFDTPTLKGRGSGKREYDLAAMAAFLRYQKELTMGYLKVGLESVHAMPMQGVTSMFSMGRGLGIWQGLLAAFEIPYTMITPQRWKKTLMDGMPKGKESSIVRAKQLFPGAELTLKKHHNRADALLIAEYLRRSCAVSA